MNWKNPKTAREVFGKYLPPAAKIIVDVGAYRGWASQRFSEWYPQAVIGAFEPYPDNYEIIVGKNIPQVICKNMAISDRVGRLVLSGDEDGLMSATGAGATVVSVPCNTLDNIIHSPVDILKIDTEGHDLFVLDGAVRVLREHKPLVIVEVVRLQPAIRCFMEKLGYRLMGSEWPDQIYK